MKKQILLLIFLNIIFTGVLLGGDGSAEYKFKYSGKDLLFIPQKSDLFENRTGLIQDFSSSKLRLDIAYSPDFIMLSNTKNNFSLGADFHAFGLLFNESEKVILQVAAIDAIFGGHISWKSEFDGYSLSSRFRVIHLSSHLVDGRYDSQKGTWKDNKTPMAFGREFIDLSFCLEYNNLKFYIGSDYIFRQRPGVLSKFNPETAMEYDIKNIAGNETSLYFSGNLKLSGINSVHILNKTAECGISFNKSRPLNLFILFYSGANYYGEYHNEMLKYAGIGFSLHLI